MDLFNKLKLDNKKILVIMLVSLALIYLDFSFILGKQIRGLNDIQPKALKLKKDLDTLTQDLKKMQELKNKEDQVNRKTVSSIKKIISESETVFLLQNLSDLANKDNVRILQIRPSREPQGKASAADKFTPIFITLDLFCDYHNFGKFINDLENSQTFIAVQTFKITPESADFMKEKINLVLKTYVTK